MSKIFKRTESIKLKILIVYIIYKEILNLNNINVQIIIVSIYIY